MKFKKEKTTRLVLDGNTLTLHDVVLVARSLHVKIKIASHSISKINKSREWVEEVQHKGKPVVYGVNTGFGSLANVSISKEHLRELQRNLIMSHSAGTGEPLPVEVVRAAMLLRANTLAKGYSGIRLSTIETLLQMIGKGVTPWIPCQGSVGASGDLAPLSHLALVLSRNPKKHTKSDSGKAYFFHKDIEEWELLEGWEAMEFAGIPRVVLEAKEGLALNNGTQISTAILALTLHDALQLVKNSDIAMAMSLESLQGLSSSFRSEIHELRPHPGQIQTAENIRLLTAGSKLLDSNPQKVQDAYSLRCHPQVMAGVRDTLDFIRNIIEREINATNDNPIICPDLKSENKAFSGGNFHAQPIAFAADFLSIVLSEVGSISERRVFRLSDKNLSEGLPSFLAKNRGLDSGLMLAQYTASALASENKSLAHPASIDSIPTCENQEDHVSMAPIAARKAQMILKNVQKIIAIEMIYAAQALDLRLRKGSSQNIPKKHLDKLGEGTRAAFLKIREYIPFLEHDQPLNPFIETMANLVKENKILTAVEKRIEGLH